MNTMNADKYSDAKRVLFEELGENYPKTKEDLSLDFLLKFADFLEGPDEYFGDDYEAYKAYEKAKYSSEQWVFIDNIARAVITQEDDENAWNNYLNWLIENYFPEFGE